jgi:hypothetical protein
MGEAYNCGEALGMKTRRSLFSAAGIGGGVLLLCGCVAAGEWSTPVDITRRMVGWASWYPSIAVDSFRTLHAAWSTHLADHYDFQMYSCKPANADTWSIPVRVSRDSCFYRGSVIAIGPGHVPYIVWQSDETAGHLYITHKSGDTWTVPEHLPGWNYMGTGIRGTSDRFDRVHITWTGTSAGQVFYARYDASGWSEPETVVDHAIHAPTDPDIAADRQGICHIVFCTLADTVGYVHQTPTGWSEPERLYSGIFGGGYTPRVRTDTLDQPQIVWWDYWHSTYCGRQGDSWTIPRWPDTIRGAPPALCVDKWNRVHEFFGDGTYSRYLGMREAVWHQGHCIETDPVDTALGTSEVLAERNRVHMLWSPHSWLVLYRYRDMDPPGVEEGEPVVVESGSTVLNPSTSSTRIQYDLSQPARVEITVVNTVGRCVWRSSIWLAGPGRHYFFPFSTLPDSGIYYCRIRVGKSAKVVKLVRVN